MKRALVLCGGGSLGSYEVGVWRYFREKGITFDMVCGTSIGSLVGALYVQDDYDKCVSLWENITVGDVMVNGINLGKNPTKNMTAAKAFAFAKTYLKNSGADTAPFKKLLSEVINPEKIKNSNIPLGLVTTSYPSMKQVNKISTEMKEEEILPYLIASSACWPIFSVMKIGTKRYVDGGFCDNLPIDLAIKMGATRIVAVKLKSYPPVPQHKELMELPFVKTIEASHDLGGIMDFEHDVLMNNMQLGYLDAKKAYGDVLGIKFAFKDFDTLATLANDFAMEAIKDDLPLWKSLQKELLSKGYNCKTSEDILIATLELIGTVLNVSPYEEYTIESFFEASKTQCLALIKDKEQIKKIQNTKAPRALAKNEEPAFIAYVYDSFKKGQKATHAAHFYKRSPSTLLITTLIKRFVEKENKK